MAFTPIDESTWERREYLEVFRQTAIYLTADVDITSLYQRTKARGEKLYPALVWCVAAVLNRHAHFRYGRDQAGRIGIWDVLHPYYTVPRRPAGRWGTRVRSPPGLRAITARAASKMAGAER